MNGASPATVDWTPSERERERATYRRSRAVRSTALSAASTIVLVALLWIALTSSPGWPRVQWTYFNLEKAIEAFPAVLAGLWLNIRIMVVCGLIIFVLGLFVAILRTLRGPVFFPFRLAGTLYVDLFRGLPLILVLLLFGYGAPALRLQGLPTNVLFWGCCALVLSYSAYVAEVFRAGIESVHPSQRAAARSLGLSYTQTLRHVVVPQAIRRVQPPLLNDLVSLQKDSGLISILGVVDAVRAAQIETASDFNYTPYVVAGLLFIALTVPMARFTDWVARRQGYAGAGAL
ncbi:amino acid ABC transporter permease [Mobilicoccus caccae]|uniref:ABC transporter permease n=1 Tax=Mobilicoccus caccae TaxID=1859295 RepID=A0ABQ6INA4_9MICO|nr:amino acid ABC transporter permease [Mobilicoccus caccae]GMA39417.1 ABC transporter permease [Mobilicoccus caccae]